MDLCLSNLQKQLTVLLDFMRYEFLYLRRYHIIIVIHFDIHIIASLSYHLARASFQHDPISL